MLFLRALANAVAKSGRLNARKKKPGDSAYNARRRYTRRAERLLKQVDEMKEKGVATVMVERVKKQAESNLKKAAALFDSDKQRKKFAKDYGLGKLAGETKKEYRKLLAERSGAALESNLNSPENRRELEAREILSSDVGSRIYAATRDLWIDYVDADEHGHIADRDKIEERIMDAFGVDSMADVVEMFEKEMGEDLYTKPDDSIRYDEVASAAKRIVRDIKRNG